jgi:hypothetical protein
VALITRDGPTGGKDTLASLGFGCENHGSLDKKRVDSAFMHFFCNAWDASPGDAVEFSEQHGCRMLRYRNRALFKPVAHMVLYPLDTVAGYLVDFLPASVNPQEFWYRVRAPALAQVDRWNRVDDFLSPVYKEFPFDLRGPPLVVGLCKKLESHFNKVYLMDVEEHSRRVRVRPLLGTDEWTLRTVSDGGLSDEPVVPTRPVHYPGFPGVARWWRGITKGQSLEQGLSELCKWIGDTSYSPTLAKLTDPKHPLRLAPSVYSWRRTNAWGEAPGSSLPLLPRGHKGSNLVLYKAMGIPGWAVDILGPGDSPFDAWVGCRQPQMCGLWSHMTTQSFVPPQKALANDLPDTSAHAVEILEYHVFPLPILYASVLLWPLHLYPVPLGSLRLDEMHMSWDESVFFN